jgi:hypothetical protein
MPSSDPAAGRWSRWHRSKYVSKSVSFIQVRPLGHFIHISITTPVVSALKNYYIESFLEAPADILNHFWIQVAVSLLKSPHGGFRSETAVA